MSRTAARARIGILTLAGGLLVLGSCRPPEPPMEGAPRLVLIVVADQMRADYLTRFGHLFEGGLKIFMERGVRFTDAHHDHNMTATAPGHASIATGCHPARHGVVGNSWYDRETGELGYSVEDGGPRRMLCPSLGEWFKRRFGSSKVYSASQKDRSAVMTAGHKADGAFWYDDDVGGFTTSEYYVRRDPPWLEAFNEEKGLDRHFGSAWTPSEFDEDTLAELLVEPVDFGPLYSDFPQTFGGLGLVPGRSFYGSIYWSPFSDEHLERLAIRLINSEGLGDDEIPDVLTLSFSALDAVGHEFGPNSRQVLETVLMLDRTLGRLFDEIDRRIGLDQVVIALTGDHGAAPVPELRAKQGLPGERVAARHVLCAQRAESKLDAKFGEADWLGAGRFIEPEALAEHDIEIAVVEKALREILEACPGVERVWTRTELLAEGGTEDELRRRFVNGFHAERSPDFIVQWDEFFMPTMSYASTHGSVHRYDSWVPLIVLAPGVAAAEVTAPVRTVDLAPTLAALAGVEPPEEIDGRDLRPHFPH